MLEIVGSAFLFDPCDALFGPEGPSCIFVAIQSNLWTRLMW